MAQPLRSTPSTPASSELEAYATEVFGDQEIASKWFDTPLWELSNLSPQQWIARKGASGLQDVKDVLLRIEYGVYS